MLSRALSYCGRALGLGRPAPPAEEERRLWGRFPCDVETTCRAASGPAAGSAAMPARVRNISRGGIALVLGRAFEPGTLLSVSLPGEPATEVLACVVRCEPRPGQAWDAGCTFATELSDQDLQLFGARREKAAASDQRGWVRFTCQARANYQVVRSPEPSGSRPADVLNISAGGIALEVSEELHVGDLLSLELSRQDEVVLTTLASVVRTAAVPDGGRLVGCNFIRELAEEQVRTLL